jgi:hypothetical protein
MGCAMFLYWFNFLTSAIEWNFEGCCSPQKLKKLKRMNEDMTNLNIYTPWGNLIIVSQNSSIVITCYSEHLS